MIRNPDLINNLKKKESSKIDLIEIGSNITKNNSPNKKLLNNSKNSSPTKGIVSPLKGNLSPIKGVISPIKLSIKGGNVSPMKPLKMGSSVAIDEVILNIHQ